MVSPLVRCLVAGLFFALGTMASVNNTIYLISNAEVPALGQPGLSLIGKQRASTCLPALFNPLNIGLIIACDPDSDDDDIQYCQEAVATVNPTATALHLSVNTECSTDDDDCINSLIYAFAQTSTKAVLIAWDSDSLDDVLDDLDVDDDEIERFWNNPDEDDDIDDEDFTHDLLFKIVHRNITGVVSQACSGIDGQAPGTFRRSLMPKQITKRQPEKRQLNGHKMMSRSRITGRNF